MTIHHYQVLGASVPPLLGRASLMRTITDHLLKPSPDHVSVVGPAYYGKSVVLTPSCSLVRQRVGWLPDGFAHRSSARRTGV